MKHISNREDIPRMYVEDKLSTVQISKEVERLKKILDLHDISY